MVVAVLTLSACSTAADVASDEPGAAAEPTQTETTPTEPTRTTPTETAPTETTPTETTPPPPELAPRPQVGNCYAVSNIGFTRQKDGSFPIACSKRHTAETYHVAPVDPFPSRRQIEQVWRRCHDRFRSYVGGSATVSTLGIALILPSAPQVRAGQGWVRCDVIERTSYNGKTGQARTGTVRNILVNNVPDRFRACSQRWPRVTQKVGFSSCKRFHQAELVPESRRLGGPAAPYPGRKASRNRTANYCEDVVLDHVPEALRYFYYFPTRGSWRAGTHDTVCWALDPNGNGLPPI
jgi:Septum formation